MVWSLRGRRGRARSPAVRSVTGRTGAGRTGAGPHRARTAARRLARVAGVDLLGPDPEPARYPTRSVV